MLNQIFIFCISLYLIIKGATMSTTYAVSLAKSFRISPYTIGFIIVAIISILPETFIGINAALNGTPAFGLGTLFGSNIADLTLVFAIIVFYAGRGLKIESKILKKHAVYPFILLLPLILGFNGHFSRTEGLVLIIAGAAFYYTALKNGTDDSGVPGHRLGRTKSTVMLLCSMALLLVGGHFIVSSAIALAAGIGVSSVLIGVLIVGLGTTIPELFFSLKSVKDQDDALAIGDLLGTVLADATIVVGILALIQPFFFPLKIIYISGLFMLGASFLLFQFMRSGMILTRKEAVLLFAFWIAFVATEFFVAI